MAVLATPGVALAKGPPLGGPYSGITTGAKVTLTVVSPSARGPWILRLFNGDSVPVRVVADARLLSFDVTPPPIASGDARSKPVHYTLPHGMRPTDDNDRGLVIPPQRAYKEELDPRLYCFSAAGLAALVPGATVQARMGWAPPKRGTPHAPFEVAPLDGTPARFGPMKGLTSESWKLPIPPPSTTLAPAPAPPSPASTSTSTSTPTPSSTSEGSDAPPRLAIRAPARMDVSRPTDLAVPVTLANEGSRPVTLLLRAETVGFDVEGPSIRPTECRWPSQVGAPVREVFTRVPAHGHSTVSVLLGSLCPDTTFDQPGIYTVRPVLDTSHASGAPIGLHTFDGEVVGAAPLLLRVREPRSPSLTAEPKLE